VVETGLTVSVLNFRLVFIYVAVKCRQPKGRVVRTQSTSSRALTISGSSVRRPRKSAIAG
jgi:hypothetical protein